MIKNFIRIIFLCFLIISCDGSKQEEEKTPPTPPQEVQSEVELKAASFADLKNWKNDDVKKAIDAFKLSCEKIKFEKNEFLSKSKIKIPTLEYKKICSQIGGVKNSDIKAFLEKNFTPYLVIYKGSDTGKFTSYYESAINASYTKSEKYKFPIYGKPKDLIEFNLQDFDKNLPNKRFVGRILNNKLVPYYSRAEIFENNLDAPVILWGDSYIDIYVMQIQGSAVATLEDGSQIRIAYAESNGRDFKGIGSILLEKKLLNPGKASMGEIKKWLKENLDISYQYMNDNQRYIFHRINPESGPVGAHGAPLTAGRSMAVDRAFVPLGALLWLETTGPNREKIEKLVVAQDIGSAIKGGIRGDYFWGSGKDDILELAGKMHATGKYYIFIPKNTEVK